MKRLNRSGVMRFISISWIALLLCTATPSPSYSTDSDEVVELSVAQVDSTIALIDDLTLSLHLSGLALDEAIAYAQADSAFAALKLDLTVDSYEVMLQAYKDDRDSWVERLIKQPIVWFAIGAWIGIQAK